MCQNRTDLAWPPGEGPWSSHSSARADWVAVQCPAFLHSAGALGQDWSMWCVGTDSLSVALLTEFWEPQKL